MPKEQTDVIIKRILEKLAEIEHIRWSQWQNYLHSFLKWDNEKNGWFLPHEKKEQWQRQLSTPYLMLSEKEKESDRAEVMKYIPILLQEIYTSCNEVREAIQCEECKGSGVYSTSSDESPCSQCNGTGFSQDGSCNDLFAYLKINK